jgi:hypothetical protein
METGCPVKPGKVHPGKYTPPPPPSKVIFAYWWRLMRRSPWGGICVWQGTGDFWLLGGLLDCCWYKWQAVLLHTDWKHQAFGVVSKWTVYCIVLWVFGHILDRRACDFKASNIDIRSISIFTFSGLGTNAFMLGSNNLSFSLRYYSSACTCIPCRDIPLSWKLYWAPEWIHFVQPITVYCILIVYWLKCLLMKIRIQCYIMSIDKYLPVFWRGVVSSSLVLRQSRSRITIGLVYPEDEGTVLLETSVNIYQLMHNIPEDLNLQQGHCEILKYPWLPVLKWIWKNI